MLYFNHAARKFNPLAAGAWRRQRHFDSVPVCPSYLRTTCQPATDTESRCFFHVTGNTPREHKQRRAEPLERPCSFAFCVLPAEGTLSAPRHITRQWEYNALPTLYPHWSNTTEYAVTRVNTATTSVVSASEMAHQCGAASSQSQPEGEMPATAHRQKTRRDGNLSRLRRSEAINPLILFCLRG